VTDGLKIVEGGPQTTVQDLGRRGHLRYGIPDSGPMDRWAFVLANRLAGNDDGAAALECTIGGPRMEMSRAGAVAATGAEMPFTINGQEAPRWTTVPVREGDVVRLGVARAGARGYLAFSGGIDVPQALGSRSTYLRGRLGGHQGRALRAGDLLPLGAATAAVSPRRVRKDAIPEYASETAVRVILGPQADRFTDEGIATFLGSAYELLPHSDRVGARLKGPRIAHVRGHDIVSDGIPLGGIQVVGDGQPIVLLVDRGSTGGYTKIATICSFDISRIAQVKPGGRVHFEAISVDDAHRVSRERAAALDGTLEEHP
jgi:biotin-dependent carboxylase-like uncharacterized protein